MLIRPTPGMVYYFAFTEGMNALKGVYKLAQILTYDEYVRAGGDILKDFYAYNGRDESYVTRDMQKLINCEIYRLIAPDDADDTTVVYAPSIYIEQSPDYNVKQYYKLGMVSSIGVTDSVEQLDYMRKNFIDMIECALGITPDPKFVSLGKVWLTNTQYQEELNKRDETKKKVVSYYADVKRLTNELASANTKIREYEQLIIQLTETVNRLKGE